MYTENVNNSCKIDENMLLLRQSLYDSLEHLDKCINQEYGTLQEGVDHMPKINRTIMLNGRRLWIHAENEQEYAEKLIKLYVRKPRRAEPISTISENML